LDIEEKISKKLDLKINLLINMENLQDNTTYIIS